MKCWALATFVAGCVLAPSASAHITLVYPAPRPGTVSAIASPCGYSPDPGRTKFQLLPPGAVVRVRWTETISHPGHYRISFDNDGQDAFVDPASYTDYYTNAAVLLDNIPDVTGTSQYSATVTLPFLECNNCTIQVMQVLTDKPPYVPGPSSDDLHRVCADVTLSLEYIFANGFED